MKLLATIPLDPKTVPHAPPLSSLKVSYDQKANHLVIEFAGVWYDPKLGHPTRLVGKLRPDATRPSGGGR